MTTRMNLDHFENLNKGILEGCGRVRSLQDELHSMHNELQKNEEEFRKGKLPRDSYRSNGRHFTKERRRLEREINREVRNSVRLVAQARKVVREQKLA